VKWHIDSCKQPVIGNNQTGPNTSAATRQTRKQFQKRRCKSFCENANPIEPRWSMLYPALTNPARTISSPSVPTFFAKRSSRLPSIQCERELFTTTFNIKPQTRIEKETQQTERLAKPRANGNVPEDAQP
jgi:hypothetical protein